LSDELSVCPREATQPSDRKEAERASSLVLPWSKTYIFESKRLGGTSRPRLVPSASIHQSRLPRSSLRYKSKHSPMSRYDNCDPLGQRISGQGLLLRRCRQKTPRSIENWQQCRPRSLASRSKGCTTTENPLHACSFAWRTTPQLAFGTPRQSIRPTHRRTSARRHSTFVSRKRDLYSRHHHRMLLHAVQQPVIVRGYVVLSSNFFSHTKFAKKRLAFTAVSCSALARQ